MWEITRFFCSGGNSPGTMVRLVHGPAVAPRKPTSAWEKNKLSLSKLNVVKVQFKQCFTCPKLLKDQKNCVAIQETVSKKKISLDCLNHFNLL